MINPKQVIHFLDEIKNDWQNLNWWKKTIITIYFRRIIGNKGVYVMEEDWDNLLILDACRYDMFEELNNILGRLEFRISRGSATNEYLRENFKSKKFYNTIYVTANPLVDYHVGNSFYKTVSVWKDGWDEGHETVLPRTMVEYALKTEEKYPHKRLIVHFVQPHYPFIGKIGDEIGDHADLAMVKDEVLGHENPFDRATVWDLIREGTLDKGTVWEAYKENLQIVLQHAKVLVEKLNIKHRR